MTVVESWCGCKGVCTIIMRKVAIGSGDDRRGSLEKRNPKDLGHFIISDDPPEPLLPTILITRRLTLLSLLEQTFPHRTLDLCSSCLV